MKSNTLFVFNAEIRSLLGLRVLEYFFKNQGPFSHNFKFRFDFQVLDASY